MAKHAKRRRFAPAVIISGLMSAFVLALSLNGTMAGFVASITNTENTAGTGYLSMEETNANGDVVCKSTDGAQGISGNSANCATINKYGGDLNMKPGDTVSTTVNIKNTGTIPAASFTLTPSACQQAAQGAAPGSATDLCAKLNIKITSGGTTYYDGAASAMGELDLVALGVGPVAAGATVPFQFDVTLDPNADATYQALKASQVLKWTFGS